MSDNRSIIHARATSRNGDALKHPTARAYSAKDWQQALKEIKDPTDRDIALVSSAIRFGTEIRLLRGGTDHILRQLSQRDAVTLAVAVVNREYAKLQKILTRKRVEDGRQDYVDMQYASQRPIPLGLPGSSLPVDDINDALIDTLPVWLYQAAQVPENSASRNADLANLGSTSLAAFSLERTLTKLWQQSLWLDWRFDDSDDGLHFAPYDKAAEILRHAWLWRQQSLSSQNSFSNIAIEQIAKNAGHKSERSSSITITGQEDRPGQKRRFVTGRTSEKLASHIQRHMWQGGVENSYVAMFLDTPLPKLGFSCSDLQDVWCVIVDACAVLANRCSEKRPVNSSTLREWALVCSRADLARSLSTCCNRSLEDVDRILNFLIYDGTDFRRGVWSMPLIKIPEQDYVMMCRSPLEIGNPIRRVEQWLERGGLSDHLSDSKRGNTYEAYVREQLSGSIDENALLQDVFCIRDPIKPDDKTIGDIDALFRIGNLICVIEVKCLLTPAEPIEQYRYQNKLEDASKQAIRKAKWLSENIHRYMDEFGIKDARELEYAPLVLTNQGFGFSRRFHNCLVCDFHFLNSYLRDNVLRTGGITHPKSGRIEYIEETIYRTEHEAREKLLERIATAPTLRRYVDRAELFETSLPWYAEPANLIKVTGIRLGHDRDKRAAALAEFLASSRVP
ncbi:hypothetical protein [Rhizobium sp. WYJ-E13]|uniref:hypothetical protein n=1 Tax=Rhizobium sp. WYJ-E13 TaxID=2849093 RepID=UPI001C1EF4B8|nr:hypothetical protein [Rhizobium sp. WYJ-E13]QWW69851.1 hypothetical protein KQ933_09185 [Rhizobium sp. WYJ-E13]